VQLRERKSTDPDTSLEKPLSLRGGRGCGSSEEGSSYRKSLPICNTQASIEKMEGLF